MSDITPPHTPRTVSPAVALALITGLYFIPVVCAVRPVNDWDIWWHLRVGQWVAVHQQVTTTDPFSEYGAPRPWLAYSWLFEVLVWKLYEWYGLVGVVAYRVVLSVAVVVALHRVALRCEPRFLLSTLLANLAALTVQPLLNERPWLFTILFSTLTLEVVLDLRRGERRWTFWALPLVYVLWANIHIQFIYGFALLGLGVVAPLLDRRPMVYWRSLLGVSVACALATLLNPYGVRVYEVVLEYATQGTPFRVVQELMALPFRAAGDWIVLGVVLLSTFTLGRQQKLSSFEVLLLLMAVFLAFRARRDIWMVILAALVILPTLLPPHLATEPSFVVKPWHCALAAVLALLLAFPIGWLRHLNEAELASVEAKQFPTGAVEHIVRRGYDGPLYNDFNLGGYLIWKLPQPRVAMDGRTNLHGEERIQRSLATWSGGENWRDDPELNRAQVVIADAEAALVSLLRLDPRFRLDYEDEKQPDDDKTGRKRFVVFVRKPEPSP